MCSVLLYICNVLEMKWKTVCFPNWIIYMHHWYNFSWHWHVCQSLKTPFKTGFHKLNFLMILHEKFQTLLLNFFFFLLNVISYYKLYRNVRNIFKHKIALSGLNYIWGAKLSATFLPYLANQAASKPKHKTDVQFLCLQKKVKVERKIIADILKFKLKMLLKYLSNTKLKSKNNPVFNLHFLDSWVYVFLHISSLEEKGMRSLTCL